MPFLLVPLVVGIVGVGSVLLSRRRAVVAAGLVVVALAGIAGLQRWAAAS